MSNNDSNIVAGVALIISALAVGFLIAGYVGAIVTVILLLMVADRT